MVNKKTLCSPVTSVVNYPKKIIKRFIARTPLGEVTLTSNYPHEIVKSYIN